MCLWASAPVVLMFNPALGGTIGWNAAIKGFGGRSLDALVASSAMSVKTRMTTLLKERVEARRNTESQLKSSKELRIGYTFLPRGAT